MLTRKSVVLAKIEGTYGLDPTPTGPNDSILVSNPEVRVDGELLTRDFVRESLSPIGHVIGKRKVTISFETELKGSGAAGTAPETSPLYQSCGMDEAIVASTSVTYSPESDSAQIKSCTMYVYFDGTMHEINGCRGSFNLNLEAGMFGKIQWNFEGKYVRPVDVALPSTTFDATLPEIIPIKILKRNQ